MQGVMAMSSQNFNQIVLQTECHLILFDLLCTKPIFCAQLSFFLSSFSVTRNTLLVKDDSIVFGLEPADGFVLGDTVGVANSSLPSLPPSNSESSSSEHHVEVHSVNTNRGIVFQTKIDVLESQKQRRRKVEMGVLNQLEEKKKKKRNKKKKKVEPLGYRTQILRWMRSFFFSIRTP